MVSLGDRQKDILLALVNDYIKRGEPVSSKELYTNYDFGIKPASIRAVLSELTDNGWLSQFHTSGGRVPTDKAYELFAGETWQNVAEEPALKHFRQLGESFLAGEMRDFVHDFSDTMHTLGVCAMAGEDVAYKSGLDELFGCLETNELAVFKEIAEDFEVLDERAKKFMGRKNEVREPGVSIGKKNQFMRSEHLSAVYGTYNVDGDKILLIAIGPKRMDYEKNLRVFKALEEAISNTN